MPRANAVTLDRNVLAEAVIAAVAAGHTRFNEIWMAVDSTKYHFRDIDLCLQRLRQSGQLKYGPNGWSTSEGAT